MSSLNDSVPTELGMSLMLSSPVFSSECMCGPDEESLLVFSVGLCSVYLLF